jgi:two-component system nitrate/nitrite response regulator NarL
MVAFHDHEPSMKILLADDQSLFREAVWFALSRAPEFDVVAERNDGDGALREALRMRPDVAFVDVGLVPTGGIDATRAIVEAVPGCRVIVVSPRADDRSLLEAVMAGASGYLTRSAHLADLVDAARRVHRGEAVIPPSMLRSLLLQLAGIRREGNEALEKLSNLTNRERQVLAFLSRGADNRRIARELEISPETARTHIQNVLTKLGVHSRVEAAAFVGRHREVGDSLDQTVPKLSRPVRLVHGSRTG